MTARAGRAPIIALGGVALVLAAVVWWAHRDVLCARVGGLAGPVCLERVR
jgi:hypothetical protein